jgi:hypothetical protein
MARLLYVSGGLSHCHTFPGGKRENHRHGLLHKQPVKKAGVHLRKYLAAFDENGVLLAPVRSTTYNME